MTAAADVAQTPHAWLGHVRDRLTVLEDVSPVLAHARSLLARTPTTIDCLEQRVDLALIVDRWREVEAELRGEIDALCAVPRPYEVRTWR